MKRLLVIALLVLVAIPLIWGVALLPPHGSALTPIQTHVSAYYLENGVEQAGTENIVTAVILNYRGFDTSYEVVVIFTGFAAVMAVLAPAKRKRFDGRVNAGDGASAQVEMPPLSNIVRYVVRLLAPFVVLFALSVMINGHASPGGGFQSGAVLGGLFIALTVVLGSEKMAPLLPERVGVWLRIIAPLSFVLVGIVGVFLTGYYLGFPQSEALHEVSAAMILIIEIGIGVGGATIFATLFREMNAQ